MTNNNIAQMKKQITSTSSTITCSTVAKSKTDITFPKQPIISLRMKIILDISNNKYPYCIVRTSLPLITTIFSFIGHTNNCTSDGVIYDSLAVIVLIVFYMK